MSDINFQHPQQLLNPHNYQLSSAQSHPRHQTSLQTSSTITDPDSIDPLSQDIGMAPPSNTQNFFNENISSFFAPYGIDVSHFPLTNPPIFQSALYSVNDDSEPRSRRRISISNGQIGQIITSHSLDNDDLYDIQPPPYPRLHQQQLPQQQQHHHHQQQPQQEHIQQHQQHLQHQHQQQPVLAQAVPQPFLEDLIPSENSVALDQQPAYPLQGQPPAQQAQRQQSEQRQQPTQTQTQPQPQPQPQSQQVHSLPNQVPLNDLHIQQATTPIKKEDPGLLPYQMNNQGVPKHKLMYNNEIIFNPDAGPIPGTAAWKKARLLERNRIAASKCRQRKKAAQLQLKEDIVKYEKEISDLVNENELLVSLYKQVKQGKDYGHFDLSSGNISSLLDKIGDVLSSKATKVKEEQYDDDEDFSDD